jgi:hypothetical protein
MPATQADAHYVAAEGLNLADGGIDGLDAPVTAGDFDRYDLRNIVIQHDSA